MSLPLEEAQRQLMTVNAAIQQLVDGKRVSELQVGSGQFARRYKYQDINIDSLVILRNELLAAINEINQAGKLPVFARNMQIPMVVSKEYYNVWSNGGTK